MVRNRSQSGSEVLSPQRFEVSKFFHNLSFSASHKSDRSDVSAKRDLLSERSEVSCIISFMPSAPPCPAVPDPVWSSLAVEKLFSRDLAEPILPFWPKLNYKHFLYPNFCISSTTEKVQSRQSQLMGVDLPTFWSSDFLARSPPSGGVRRR